MHGASCPKCGAASDGASKSCGGCGADSFSSRRRHHHPSSSSSNNHNPQFPLAQLDDQLPLWAVYDLCQHNLPPHSSSSSSGRRQQQQQPSRRHHHQRGFTGSIGRQAGSYVYLAGVRRVLHEEENRKKRAADRRRRRRD
ncbi:hypothetical protein B0T21DRAFT_349584 [Apiosordaria backusii]|uniref:Uncharacterized protein n=1 Tax=Apiosordaria backusii TaxID=314023 RepID=A0AA40EBW6_9PEZI|nr:hypothetical protein B0T21DRAFT_349584 [Apiosordaria backusii]